MADSRKSSKTCEGTPHPWFFVSVASKGLSSTVSFVFAATCGEIHKCCR